MLITLQRGIELSFYFLLAAVPLIFNPANFELFEFPKMILVYAITIIILFLWTTKSILLGKIIFHRTILDIPLILFLLSLSLSTITSIDRYTSFWGFYSRNYGGLLSITAFALLYWGYVSNMDKRKTKNVIRFLLASTTVVSIWGILEHTGHSPSCLFMKGTFDATCWVPKVQERVFATFGQPNWMAAWLAGVAPLSWTLMIRKTKNEKRRELQRMSRIASYVLPGLVFLTLLYTKSTSGLIGFAVAFAVFGILVLPHATSYTRRMLLTLIAIHLSLIALIGTRFTPSISQILAERRTQSLEQSRSKDLTTTNHEPITTDSFAIRKIVWRGAIDIWRDYPIFGSGVETFAYTYYNFRPIEQNLTSEWDLLYNKAHNEYLHYLANTGVVGLAAYLLLITSFLWWSAKTIIKTRNSVTPIATVAGFISIRTTNLVGFTTVPVAILFFLYPAMAQSPGKRKEAKGERTPHKIISRQLPMLPLLFPIAFSLLPVASLYRADTLYARADKLNNSGQGRPAAEKLNQAIRLYPHPRYYNELATATSLVAVNLSENTEERNLEEAERFAKLTAEFSSKALEVSPQDVNFWTNRAVALKRLSAVDKKYFDLAVDSLEKAAKLAPTDPEIHYNLGVLYDRTGDTKNARKFLEKAAELKPNYYDGRLGLAEFYLKIGEKELGIQKLEEAIKIDPRDTSVIDLLEGLKKERR